MSREEYLRAVTVGELAPLQGRIELVPYDREWPAEFMRQESRIRSALGEKVVLLEHVGSTSVPGLPAKPVIDMVLAVSDPTDEPAYVPPLENQGFALTVREPDWFEHRLLQTVDRGCNLHVFAAGCEEIGRMLAFRDRLREHEDERRVYARVKRKLAARTWKYTQDYADAKSEVVEAILERATEHLR